MFGGEKHSTGRKDHAECSGCSLCLLVCPAWRSAHDPRMTPEGRAKALQHGATAADLAGSLESCVLCGACEPVCPENIDLVGMTLDLRARIADTEAVEATNRRMAEPDTPHAPAGTASDTVLIPGRALSADADALRRALQLIEGTACGDEGADILAAFAAGVPIPPARRERFLKGLRRARTIVVEDGLWLRPLAQWLPGMRVAGLGEALSNLPSVRAGVRKSDLYVIEPRAYHADYERLVKHYDRLRADRDCAFNLDLQRIAIPAAGQAEWILKGLEVDRIVVERLDDAAAFAGACALPVVHVAQLADH